VALTSISHPSEHLDQHRAPQYGLQDKAEMLKNIDVLIQINDTWNNFIHNQIQITNRCKSDI